jgi:hypothetical protein
MMEPHVCPLGSGLCDCTAAPVAGTVARCLLETHLRSFPPLAGFFRRLSSEPARWTGIDGATPFAGFHREAVAAMPA